MLKNIKDPQIRIALAFLLTVMPFFGFFLAVLILMVIG